MTQAHWIRFVHSQEYIKEILDYCKAECDKERERVLKELITYCNDEENIIYFDQPNGGWSDDMIDKKFLIRKIESLRTKERP